ncbi:MAG: hypothetical protein AVDCRST_MAG66-3834, partial [uncultured Pseudonocardia sp.]
ADPRQRPERRLHLGQPVAHLAELAGESRDEQPQRHQLGDAQVARRHQRHAADGHGGEQRVQHQAGAQGRPRRQVAGGRHPPQHLAGPLGV